MDGEYSRLIRLTLMRNTPDVRRQRWSLLPPGLLLELTAVRARSGETDRCNPDVAGRGHPLDDELTALVARARFGNRTCPRTQRRGGQARSAACGWSLLCRVHPHEERESRPAAGREMLTVHCRLTAAILSDADAVPGGRQLAATLHAFQLHARTRPFDADVRRHLRLYLLLRLLAHGAADDAVLDAIRNLLRHERRRMRRRLRGALRRLHRKMNAGKNA